MNKQKAFTLAEVLITLGIIGVVAAITLPVLIHKFQMKVFETAFKKEYALFQSALEYISIENDINKCYESYAYGTWSYSTNKSECGQLKTEIIKRLSLINYIKIISYNDKNYVMQNGKVINPNASLFNSDTSWYRSKSGAIYGFSHLPYVILDLNGEAKPNKWGYDVFYMHLTPLKSAKRVILTDNLQGAKENGGVFMRQIINPAENNNSFKSDTGGF